MIKVKVQVDIEGMKRLHRGMEREIKKAAARGLNRAADTAATTGAREVSKATKIKVRDVRKRMSVRGARPERLISEVQAHPYSPNLAEFRATENAKGVAASAWEGRKTYRHAFKHPRTQRVVARVGQGRTPLKGLKGPSVRKTFMRPDITSKVETAGRDRFKADFEREVTRRLG